MCVCVLCTQKYTYTYMCVYIYNACTGCSKIKPTKISGGYKKQKKNRNKSILTNLYSQKSRSL